MAGTAVTVGHHCDREREPFEFFFESCDAALEILVARRRREDGDRARSEARIVARCEQRADSLDAGRSAQPGSDPELLLEPRKRRRRMDDGAGVRERLREQRRHGTGCERQAPPVEGRQPVRAPHRDELLQRRRDRPRRRRRRDDGLRHGHGPSSVRILGRVETVPGAGSQARYGSSSARKASIAGLSP